MDRVTLERFAEARQALHDHYGYDRFRLAQARVVRSVLAGRDTLAVLPTGGGKSVCFQVPALVLGGLTVVVSPLISLMQDQVEAALARGIPAAALHSALRSAEREQIEQAVGAGEMRLLYVSPERFERFADWLFARGIRPSRLAVDEAHCIAEWGHDFRPSYRRLRASRRRLGWPPAVALTGSATPAVRDEIARALDLGRGRGFDLHLGSFDRRNLWFGVRRVRNERARADALLELLAGDDRTAIVYAPTRNTTEAITRLVRTAGHRAMPYHAGMTSAERRAALDAFLQDDVEIVVATCAFGMGIDKPSVRLVVHWTLPATPEAYYQEAGRAGRDGRPARCVLLYRPGDVELPRRQLEVTFPPRELVERIWRGDAGRRGVPGNVLASAERLRRELRPERGPVNWRPVQLRRKAAAERIGAMERYAGRRGCRRRQLLAYFGERLDECAGCDACHRTLHEPLPDPAACDRLRRLHQVLAGRRGAWNGWLLEPETLVRLAARPPADVAALAEVPGVGPALAERLGGVIFRALGGKVGGERAGEAGRADGTDGSVAAALEGRLAAWRASAARSLGVPEYAVCGDSALAALVAGRPSDRAGLRQVPGIGPRMVAKFGDELIGILSESRPG